MVEIALFLEEAIKQKSPRITNDKCTKMTKIDPALNFSKQRTKPDRYRSKILK